MRSSAQINYANRCDRTPGKFFLMSGILFFSAVCNMAIAHAEELPGVELTGFGTFGVAYNTSNKVDLLRDLSQTNGVGFSRKFDFGLDSNLGLQLDMRSAASTISGAVQVVAKRDHAGITPDLTLAFVRYAGDDWSLRAGRVGFDVYPNADSRLIGYSYVWQRPPVEFFGPLIFSHFDGADIQFRHRRDNREWRLKLYSGITNEKVEVTPASPYFLLNHSRLHGGHLEYRQDPWSFRASYAELHVANENPALQSSLDQLRSPGISFFVPNAISVADKLQMKDKVFRFSALSLTYDNGPWLWEAMIGRTLTGNTFIPDDKAGFISVSYRRGKFTHYGVLSAIRPLTDPEKAIVLPGAPPELIAGANALNTQMKNQRGWQTSLSAGLRYDLTPQSNLKFQIDFVRSRDNLLLRRVQPDWNREAVLLSATYNFIF